MGHLDNALAGTSTTTSSPPFPTGQAVVLRGVTGLMVGFLQNYWFSKLFLWLTLFQHFPCMECRLQGCIVHLGHWAMARPIIEGISCVRARELIMSQISRMQFWPTAVNSHTHMWLLIMSRIRKRVIWVNLRMRIGDYWPCREFVRARFGLTRAYATIDNVANSHALD